MKKLIGVMILLGCLSSGLAQKAQQRLATDAEKSALQSMVDTELAFAKMSVEQGIRPAFMQFIADDGILFRPRAVRGKQWMTEHPLPPSEKRPLLNWYPAIAGIARAGDMGYTTGPWEYKSDIHDAQAVAWGNFLTVWKRQADGSWKFAIDLGISNPQPAQAAGQWEQQTNYKAAKIEKSMKTASAADLLARDREFSKASASRGARTAFADFAAPDVRVYRDEKFPFVGKESSIQALPAASTLWTWEPAAGDASTSHDLGYTYGTYTLTSNAPTSKTTETGNYYRIWKKEGGHWKVLFDLTNPIPADTKKN